MRIRAADYEPISESMEAMVKQIIRAAPYPTFLGLRPEEVRTDYARMRLPFRPELNQPAGIVHGGAILSLIDTVVVLAICSSLPTPPRRLVTIDVHTQFLAPVVGRDCIAEAVVRKRGRSIVFLRVEVRTDDGALVAEGALAYKVSLAADG
jgi:uncharacterized protein (TIGR00369 family)